MSEEIYDITVIGGGPAGMFAGFYGELRDAKVQIIESLSEMGGQVMAIYPEKTVLDVAGFPAIKASKLVADQEKQLAGFSPKIRLNETVENVKKSSSGYEIITNKSTSLTKGIVIATGVGAFNPRRLAAENADEFEGKNLFYTIKDLEHFKNHDVLVAGGGDAAIDQALLLERTAKKVYLLHRRNQYRAMEHSVDLLNQSSIQQVTPYLIKKLEANGQKVTLTAKKMKSEETKKLTVDDVVVNYGFIAKGDAIEKWEAKPEMNRGEITIDKTGKTNLENVYSIGDVAMYKGKQPLLTTAFGEAPVAINSLMASIYPDRRGPVHSTSIMEHRQKK